MKPINAEDPQELEKFADLVERKVVTLKENKHTSDLEGGSLYAIVLEKILYSASTRDGLKKRENWSLSRNYKNGLQRKQNTKFKHQRYRMVFLVQEEGMSNGHGHISGLETSMTTLARCATKNTQIGSAKCSKEWKIRRSGRQRRSFACVIVA